MDPHIFADQYPDPGSQNLADPTDPDPDPKHWRKVSKKNCAKRAKLIALYMQNMSKSSHKK